MASKKDTILSNYFYILKLQENLAILVPEKKEYLSHKEMLNTGNVPCV